jgi:hypothetical protein
MIGRKFVKQLRLRGGRVETITTRFELDPQGGLIEHVTIEVHERGSLPAPVHLPPVRALARGAQPQPMAAAE